MRIWMAALLIVGINAAAYHWIGESPFKADESLHLDAAAALSADFTFESLTRYNDSKGPLFHIVYAAWFMAFGEHLASARIFTALIAVSVLVGWALLVSGTYRASAITQGSNRQTSAMSCMLLLPLFPYFSAVSVLYMSEMLTLWFLIAGIILYQQVTENGVRLSQHAAALYWGGALLFFGAAALVRQHAIVFLIAVTLVSILNRRMLTTGVAALTGLMVASAYLALLGGVTQQTNYHTDKFGMGARPWVGLHSIAILGMFLGLPTMLNRRRAAVGGVMMFVVGLLVVQMGGYDGNAKNFGIMRTLFLAIDGVSAAAAQVFWVASLVAGIVTLWVLGNLVLDPSKEQTVRMVSAASIVGVTICFIGPSIVYDRYLIIVVPFAGYALIRSGSLNCWGVKAMMGLAALLSSMYLLKYMVKGLH